MLGFMFFMILLLLLGYICAKGIQALTGKVWLGLISILLSIFTFFSIIMRSRPYLIKSLFEKILPDEIALNIANIVGGAISILKDIGYFHLGFVIYFSMCCIGTACVYCFHHTLNYRKILGVCSVLVICVLCYGYNNALNITIKNIQIPSSIDAKICFISDIHVGAIHSEKTLQNIEKLIEQIQPDIVLIGGDSLDINENHNNLKDIAIKYFSRIAMKYKTIAVIGNHEVYSGLNSCVNVLRQCGITVLLDEKIKIGDITIVGRLDSMIRRLSLNRIVRKNMSNVVVLDHEPENLIDKLPDNIVLYLCGHTHGGQMFPMNFIVDCKFRPTGKLGKIGETHYYISSGAGFWGPPYRVGSTPEIVNIKLKRTAKIADK